MKERERFYIPEIRQEKRRDREYESIIPLRFEEISEKKLFNNYEIKKNIIPIQDNIIFENKFKENSKEILNNLTPYEQFNTISDFLGRSTETITREKRRSPETRIEIFPEISREIFRPFIPRTDTAAAAGDVPLPIPTVPALTPEERAKLASQRRVAKLRNPHFQSLLRFVRATPHLWDQIQGFQQRREMMLKGTGDARDNHRQFAPLLAGMAVNAEARAYLQIALDESATQESDALKAVAEVNGGYYAPVLVIGAGIHGSIFNAQLMADRPDIQALTVDQDARLGGNFRRPNGPAFRTNSRNRAEDRDLPKLPGTPGNINSMGEYATMQVSDASADVYADNDTFGLVTALNQYLSGNTMLGVEVKAVARNQRGKDGKYKVTLEDAQSGKTLTVTTDTIVTASGLGDRKYGLDTEDTQTAELLVDNFEEAVESGKIPQVLPYDIFLQLVGDRSVQFPLEPFIGKRIAVVGDKDSGNTSIEYLMGLAPEYRGSVAQMGRPTEIAWYGPKFKTQAEYRACTRTRYAEIGLFLPRTEGANAPIQPIAERVNRLRQAEDGRVTVLSNGTEAPERAEDFDYVILATGFEDQKAKVFQPLYGGGNFDRALRSVDSRDRRGNRTTIARQMVGESVYFVGPTANIPVSDGERREVDGLAVPENSVAIWRYSDRTAATARQVGMELPRRRDEAQGSVPSVTPVELPDDGNLEFSLSARQVNRMFPPEVNYANLLKIQALAEGSPAPAGEVDNDMLAFTVQRAGASEDGLTYTYAAALADGANSSTQAWVRRFMNNEINQRLLAKLTRGTSGSVTVRVPITDGKLPVDDVEISTRSRKSSK